MAVRRQGSSADFLLMEAFKHGSHECARLTYFAEQGPDDARPVAVKQALLIDGVLANQIFHHQQKGSDAVSFQSALYQEKRKRKIKDSSYTHGHLHTYFTILLCKLHYAVF